MLRTINTAMGLFDFNTEKLVAWLTSETAIILYIFVILSLIAILVVSIILADKNSKDETEIHVIGDVAADGDGQIADLRRIQAFHGGVVAVGVAMQDHSVQF